MTQSWESTAFEQEEPADDVFQPDEELVDELPSFVKSSRRRPAMLLATVVAGGLAAIVTMRSLTGGLGQVMADTGVEEAVSGFLDFMREGTSDLKLTKGVQGDPFADLVTDHYASMQVPADNLRSNPFVTPWTVTSNTNFAPKRPLSISQRRAIRRLELEGLGELCDIQSVMTGTNPIATINEQVVQIGAELDLEDPDAICILREVNSDSVVIEATDDNIGMSVMLTISLRRE